MKAVERDVRSQGAAAGSFSTTSPAFASISDRSTSAVENPLRCRFEFH